MTIDKKYELTRGGVSHNLDISPYVHTIKYRHEVIIFRFSSNLYLNKFKDKLQENRQKTSEIMSKRFGFKIMNDLISDIYLYITIEKRGISIECKEGGVTCLEKITLDGEKMIVRN